MPISYGEAKECSDCGNVYHLRCVKFTKGDEWICSKCNTIIASLPFPVHFFPFINSAPGSYLSKPVVDLEGTKQE